MSSPRRTPDLTWLALALVALAAGAWIFCCGRYPSAYIDDAFFVWPAWKAANGRPFVYLVSAAAPWGDRLWAYHGPLYPHLLVPLFRIFGFSREVARLPNVLGGWLALVLIVLALRRRGYRIAGLVAAVLWIGDRASQEILYARMDGLALLFLACAFLLAVEAAEPERSSPRFGFASGIAAALAVLANPVCLLAGAILFLILLSLRRFRGAAFFAAGSTAALPLLVWFWGGHSGAAIGQFLWHAHRLKEVSALASVRTMIVVLRWSRYWFLALIVFSAGCVVHTVLWLRRNGMAQTGLALDRLFLAGMIVGTLPILFRASTHPYYIVYFSLWPIVYLATLVESDWPRVRWLALAMGLVWCSSAAWNLLRLREALANHRALANDAIAARLDRLVPDGATLIVSPLLYSIPIDAGRRQFDLTTWFRENQRVCPDCYVLIEQDELGRPVTYVSPADLGSRRVLYAGPAYPDAPHMQLPVVLYSAQTKP